MEDIKGKMEQAFKIEDDFSADTVQTVPVKNGTAYVINRGEIEFSRGMIEAYVYIVFNDGEIVAERVDTPQELELWSTHLA
jgi:hypothetical protein